MGVDSGGGVMSQATSFRRRGRLPQCERLFTPQQAREIRTRYGSGETVHDLALTYRADDKTIRLILRGQAGYPLEVDEEPVALRTAAEEKARAASRNRDAVVRLHAEGKTSAETARLSGLSMATVWKVGSELSLKWPRRPVPIRHGTLAGYRRCGPPSCAACRAANTEAHRRTIDARRAS